MHCVSGFSFLHMETGGDEGVKRGAEGASGDLRLVNNKRTQTLAISWHLSVENVEKQVFWFWFAPQTISSFPSITQHRKKI